MLPCLFASDLHGRLFRYEQLWRCIADEVPLGVFLGGDLLPHPLDFSWQTAGLADDFVAAYLLPGFRALRARMGAAYPRIFLILGNDDPRATEGQFLKGQAEGLWEYMHGRRSLFQGISIYGYSCIPPSPFLLKDWERYDVSQFVDPGCVSPEEGNRTAGPVGREIRYTTIAAELAELVGTDDLSEAVLLTHCPPYGCDLDRAALDGQYVDHAPLDVHIGSIALQRLVEERQPMLTLHGHVHESRRLTGNWRQFLGRTLACNAATEHQELALVRCDLHRVADMTLELFQPPASGSS